MKLNFVLLIALIALNMADALLTKMGAAHEINPAIGWLMVVCPDTWIHIKVAFTSCLGVFLVYVNARWALALGVVVYSFLCLYHSFLIEMALR